MPPEGDEVDASKLLEATRKTRATSVGVFLPRALVLT